MHWLIFLLSIIITSIYYVHAHFTTFLCVQKYHKLTVYNTLQKQIRNQKRRTYYEQRKEKEHMWCKNIR